MANELGSSGFSSIRDFVTQAAGPSGVDSEKLGSIADPNVDPDEPEEELSSFGQGPDTSPDNPQDPNQVNQDSPKPETKVEAPKAGDTEEIEVRGLDGKKSKIKIDYTNKEAIKDAYKKAQGMRLAFKERDDVKKELEAYRKGEKLPEATKADLEAYQVISKAFSEGGVEGLIDVLNKSKGGYKGWEESKDAYSKLLPSERAEVDAKREVERANQRAEEAQRIARERTESLVKQQEAVDKARLKSVLTPAFHRHSLSKDVEDADAGARIDKAIWRDSIAEIRALDLPEGQEPSAAQVDRIFKKNADSYRKVIQVKTQQKVAETINKKKEQAANSLQTAAASGMPQGNSVSDFKDMVSKGNLKGAIAKYLNK